MSSLFCASRGRHTPDGVHGEAGPTPSYDEAAQYPGANVVAESYRSPRTACGQNLHATCSQNPSVYAWPAQHTPASPVFYDSSYGTPHQPYGSNSHSSGSAAPCAPVPMSQSLYWGTPDGRQDAPPYMPYNHEHDMRQQHLAYADKCIILLSSRTTGRFEPGYYGTNTRDLPARLIS